jgi:hypothetical protein
MLKYIVTIIMGSLLTVHFSIAQVYDGTNFPQAGSTYPMYADTTVGWYYMPESSLLGPAPWYLVQVSYDFVDTTYFQDPAAVNFSSSFPSSDVAITDPITNEFFSSEFLEFNNGDVYTNGGIVVPPSGNEIPMVYNEPGLWLDLPLSAGSSMRDTVVGIINALGSEVGIPVDSIRLIRTLYRNDTVDAVGTLSVPGTIFENAIRRIVVDRTLDSIYTKTGGLWQYDPNLINPYQVDSMIEWYHADEDWLIAQAAISDYGVHYFRYSMGEPPTIRLEFNGLPSDISILDTIHNFSVEAISIADGSLVSSFMDSVRVTPFPDTTGGFSNYWFMDEVSVVPSSGVADFTNLRFYEPGVYQLRTWSDTVLADTSAWITVHPVASQLSVNIENTSSSENGYIPTITVYALTDSNTVDELFYEGNVRVGKLNGSGSLRGTLTKPLVDGVATFDDLTISNEGNHTLLFYSPRGDIFLQQDTLTVSVAANSGTWQYHTTDTLDEYVNRANEFVWFGNADGYLSGTSRGGFTEVGQHYDFEGRAELTEVICHFANRFHVGDDTDTFELRVYDAGLIESNYFYSGEDERWYMDSVPTALIGSQYFAADSMKFGDFWIQRPTSIPFDNPPQIRGDFIITLVGDSELSNDTIMLWHSVPGDALQEYRTLRRSTVFGFPQQDTLWVRDKYHRPSFDVDLMMSPVLDIDTLSVLTDISTILPSDVEMTCSPNPATDQISVVWKSSIYSAGTLELYLNGKLLHSGKTSAASENSIDMTRLPSGTYNLVLRSDNGVLLSTEKILKIKQ